MPHEITKGERHASETREAGLVHLFLQRKLDEST